MPKGIIDKESDPRIIYADIIDLPHHQSDTHPHMSLYDRAAQFAPFAALTGYDDMISEEARETGTEINLEDSASERISLKLNLVADAAANGYSPLLSITYFVPDELKSGGEYVTVTERIKKVDTVRRKIILERTEGYSQSNAEIDIDRITDIHGELVDHIDGDID